MERDLEMLAHDVRCGYVSRAAAESTYGVMFGGDGTIEATATAKRRAEMKAQGLPVDQPVADTIAPLPFAAEAVGAAAPADTLRDDERIALAMNCRCCS